MIITVRNVQALNYANTPFKTEPSEVHHRQGNRVDSENRNTSAMNCLSFLRSFV